MKPQRCKSYMRLAYSQHTNSLTERGNHFRERTDGEKLRVILKHWREGGNCSFGKWEGGEDGMSDI